MDLRLPKVCRACFKVLNSTPATEAPALIDILEMPGLIDKLAACISNVFITTKRGSKYLCLGCFERVNEFFKFREMCLQSMRRFEANEVSKYVITYIGESIKSQETKDVFLSSESGTNKEFEVQSEADVAKIFKGPLEIQELEFNKESIKSEGANDILLANESVIKAEYELNDQPMEVAHETLEICQETKAQSNSANKRRVNKVNDVQVSVEDLESIVSVKNEPVFYEDEEELSSDYSQSCTPSSNMQMSWDDLETAVCVRNKPISNESEVELSSDDSQNSTPSSNVHKDSQKDVNGEEEATFTVSKNSQNPAMDGTRKPKTYSCGKCQKLYRKETKFLYHIRTNKCCKPYQCTYKGCPKSYGTPQFLHNHLRKHEKREEKRRLKMHSSNSERYYCMHEGCDKTYVHARSLRVHQKNRHNSNIERYYCMHEGCDKSFSHPSSHSKHRMKHYKYPKIEHNLKRYHCPHEDCDKSYDQQDDLKIHQISHENSNNEQNIKIFTCTHEGCDKSFIWAEDFRQHQIRHDNSNSIKRFHCTHEGCDKTYSRATPLREHQRNHSNIERYHCPHED